MPHAIRYEPSRRSWELQKEAIRRLATAPGVRSVCEVGGGANPMLPLQFVRDHGLEYTVLDISASELAKADPGYRKVLADVCAPAFEPPAQFDFVFSRLLAEHVGNGERFHRNILPMLRPGGTAFHFFPTLYALPFVLNRLMPERLSEAILLWLNPGREKEGKHGKFPARYAWCRGPTAHQLERLHALGYEVVEYVGFFGHEGYYRHLGPLRWLHSASSAWLLSHPIPVLTSYALVVLRRPAESSSAGVENMSHGFGTGSG